ncbi:MAG: hypothetical protein WA210_22665 [Burkholderiaceae bacterium]
MSPASAAFRVVLVLEDTDHPGLLDALRRRLPMLAIRHLPDFEDAMFHLCSNLYQAAVVDIDRFGAGAGAAIGQVRRSAPRLWLLGVSARVPRDQVHAVAGSRWMPLVHPAAVARALQGQWRTWRGADAGSGS